MVGHTCDLSSGKVKKDREFKVTPSYILSCNNLNDTFSLLLIFLKTLPVSVSFSKYLPSLPFFGALKED